MEPASHQQQTPRPRPPGARIWAIRVILVICMPAWAARANPDTARCLQDRPVEAAESLSIRIERPGPTVGRYGRIEFAIDLHRQYENPFDPNEVALAIELTAPSGRKLRVPAFFGQDFERRNLQSPRNRSLWCYPLNRGRWKARFAPSETGPYSARAVLSDRRGPAVSRPLRFTCTASPSKGFVVVGSKDSRFLEFSTGQPFFAIGQNLAFIGEGQYVNLGRAEQIFGKLAANGANFLRIWTCCQDWALAIEARKSAWGRSWSKDWPIGAAPGDLGQAAGRQCVKLEGRGVRVQPTRAVALRPGHGYVLAGRFMAEQQGTALKIESSVMQEVPLFEAKQQRKWQRFRHEFTTGDAVMWLGSLRLAVEGPGRIWLDELSLKDTATGAELLVEARLNRPVLGRYNQLDCFLLDELVAAAEANGIYLMLCLLTRDLYMDSLAEPGSDRYRRAIENARNFMRYAVARWGCSTSVAAWEYFNEIDPGKPTEVFYRELARYLDRIDPYRHLRATSTWAPSARDCRLPSLDIAQLHHYMRLGTEENLKDEVAVILEKSRFLREHAGAKPTLIGEFGLATPKWGMAEQMKRDTEAVHFHNCLWASAFAGNCGAAMFWWWEQLDRQDAYRHYEPLSAFFRGVRLEGTTAPKAASTGPKLYLLGHQGPGRAYIWLADPQANWYNRVVQGCKPGPITGARLRIRELAPGRYTVQWWDTWQGKTAATAMLSTEQGELTLAIPPFTGDIACKILPDQDR